MRVARTCGPRTPRARGSALLEVLITLLVLAVGLLAVARLQAGLAYYGGLARARTEALALGQGELEHLRLFADVDGYRQGMVDGARSDTGTNARFELSRTVTDLTDPVCKQVDISVHWTDARGTHAVGLSTLIAPRQPVQGGQVLAGLL